MAEVSKRSINSVRDSEIGGIPKRHESSKSVHTVSISSSPQTDAALAAAASKKAGRKPSNDVPESKRKAQNRAAQRAFRERKEKRLQELEARVNELEDEKLAKNSENEFLRLQIDRLMKELATYRNAFIENLQVNGTKLDSSQLSESLGTKWSTDSSFSFPVMPVKSHKASSSSGSSPSSVGNAPSEAGGESSCTSVGSSPLNASLNGSLLTKPSGEPLTSLFQPVAVAEPAKEPFEETVSDFCLNMSEACGTEQQPVPKVLAKSGSSARSVGSVDDSSSPASLYSNSTKASSLSAGSTRVPDATSLLFDLSGGANGNAGGNVAAQPSADPLMGGLERSSEDKIAEEFLSSLSTDTPNPYSSLFDVNQFDTSLVFDDPFNVYDEEPVIPESDIVKGLTTEESLYDPLGVSSISGPSERLAAGGAENEDEMVVPNNEKYLLTCSAVWDRITSHPRYGDLDIEGLCQELKTKAKCSERGVVIEKEQVDELLSGCPSKE